jgi:hypothetical protein
MVQHNKFENCHKIVNKPGAGNRSIKLTKMEEIIQNAITECRSLELALIEMKKLNEELSEAEAKRQTPELSQNWVNVIKRAIVAHNGEIVAAFIGLEAAYEQVTDEALKFDRPDVFNMMGLVFNPHQSINELKL